MEDYGDTEQTGYDASSYEDVSGHGHDWGGDAGSYETGEQAWAGDGYATADEQQAYAMYDQQDYGAYDQQGYGQQDYDAYGPPDSAGPDQLDGDDDSKYDYSDLWTPVG